MRDVEISKLLLLPLLAGVLFACSKADGNLTLSCYGTLLSSISNNEPDISKITRNYKFSNDQFSGYECVKKADAISCNSIRDENGTRERKRIIYDTKSLVFVESSIVLNLVNLRDIAQNTISKSEFIGTCQKPIFH